ncbi:MAG: Loki-CTERM sorting domain-containing protein [Candidatus Bathyarchaeia archaeon]
MKTRQGASFAFILLILTTSGLSLVTLVPQAKALSLYDSGNPTPDEQLVLQYINRARANPIAEGQRLGIDIHEGLVDPNGPELVGPRPPLAMNPALLTIANGHSEDMYDNNYFSHTDPNGTTAFQRMTNAGYNYVSAGENMAAGTDMTATQLEDFMMVDSGTPGRPHRVNLLDIFPFPPPAYEEVGVGYYSGSASNSYGNAFITEDFGTAANAGPFLLGVVYDDANGNNFYDIGEGVSGVTITPSSGNYYAISSSSGGYAFPIGTSGTITVTASGNGFGPITKTITLTGFNIELDFTSQGSTLVTTVSQSTTQATSQSITQTQATSQIFTQTTQTTSQTLTQTAAASTTQTSLQSTTQYITQTSPSTTAPTLLESVTFQSSPANFPDATSPATITACGNTYANSQPAACGISFGATANLPFPSTGWQFNHWTWAGGVACTSDTTNPVECSAYNSGGVLIAVYAAQINIMTNPASSAFVNLGTCSEGGEGNGVSFYSTTFGSTTVTACNIPSGYSFLNWTCKGGLTCSSTANPTTLTINGPGSIELNLQTQIANVTSTSMPSTSEASAETSSASSAVTSTILAATSTAPVTTTLQPTASSTQATQTSTVSSQLTMTPIPGFPWESIIAGLVLGLTALALTRRRRR